MRVMRKLGVANRLQLAIKIQSIRAEDIKIKGFP